MGDTFVGHEVAADAKPLGGGPGEPLLPDEIVAQPPFSHITKTRLEKTPGSVWLRVFEPGEYICRQGSFGSTAFYILDGTVRVEIRAGADVPKATPRRHQQHGGNWLKRLFGRDSGRSLSLPKGRMVIPVDATRDVPRETRTISLHKDDIFGEMTCLDFLPRAADCIAETRVYCLEMLRNIFLLAAETPEASGWRKRKLKFLAENPAAHFSEPRPADTKIQSVYRKRAKEELHACDLLESVPEAVLEPLVERADLVSFEPGEVICAEGDAAEEFFLIRRGFVKVSQRAGREELVYNYMSRGQYFGEIGLMQGQKRTATCTAVGHVNAIALTRADFEDLTNQYPQVRQQILEMIKPRLQPIAERQPIREAFDFKEFTDQELMQGRNLLLFDLDRCTRCDECVRACADSHDGITRLRREGHRFDKFLVPTSCRSCRDPVCLSECPVGSIGRSTTGAIIIEDWCIGCRKCEENCPYGNIQMHQTAVQAGTAVYKQQQPVRRIGTHCTLAPSIDLSALPFGLEYDPTRQWLSYADVTRHADEETIRAFSNDPAYQAAIEKLLAQRSTTISLPVLPSSFAPPPRVEGSVKLNKKERAVEFRGVIHSDNRGMYLETSPEPAYRAGVDQAQKESSGMSEVLSKAYVCDLCESLDSVPRCVYACPHDAAFRIDAAEFFKKWGTPR